MQYQLAKSNILTDQLINLHLSFNQLIFIICEPLLNCEVLIYYFSTICYYPWSLSDQGPKQATQCDHHNGG